jgi:1-deoxy-D-xylulose-5-phosphate reductoisomerase
MKKRIAILGSTGSIGTQTLEVIAQNPDHFEVEVLTANNNIELLIEQAKRFRPNVVVISNSCHYDQLKEALRNEPVKVYAGRDAVNQVVEMESIDVVLTAMVGYSGLIPTCNAIKAGKNIALANKETMVVAGEIINRLAIENRVSIYPVDSEHSAIFQCLVGEFNNEIEKIYLTASGGPFRGFSMEQLANVSKTDALKHPNWDMGAKITIDSASMMNKGFEVIEAKWLFGLKPEQIDVIVHPQSIIHSIVQFRDGSMKAQMGLPDMKLPIQYALNFPERLPSSFKRFSFLDYPELSFEQPNTKNFRNLALAFEALNQGGNMPCILNAANEVVVQAFLTEKISFLQMPEIIEKIMREATFVKNPNLEDYVSSDKEVRIKTAAQIKKPTTQKI